MTNEQETITRIEAMKDALDADEDCRMSYASASEGASIDIATTLVRIADSLERIAYAPDTR